MITWDTNLHTHSLFSDGKGTIKQMAEEALKQGLTVLGLSDHSPVPLESDWNMPESEFTNYLSTLEAVQQQFPALQILKGIEIDFLEGEKSLSPQILAPLDYTIGSLHYLRTEEGFKLIDYSPENFKELFSKCFDGEIKHLTKCYTNQVSLMIEAYNPTILGHIDLICKFNQKNPLFDETDKNYLYPLYELLLFAKERGVIVEINTGAISRGYKTHPYPNPAILDFCAKNKVKMTLTGDTHAPTTLTTAFPEALNLAKKCGLKTLYRISKNKKGQLIKEEIPL